MTPWVRNLVLANIVMYLVTMTFQGVANNLVFVPTLALARPWTLVTYMFLHANLMHILFNMLGLYFFGSRVESRLGSARFLGLYFVSGIAAAIASMIMSPRAPIVGASGAVFGVLLAYARYWPRDQILIWFIPMEARIAVVVMAGLELVGFGGAGIAHFAHLGGFAGALVYLMWSDRTSSAARFRARATTTPTRTTADLDRWNTIRTENLHPVNRQELERLRQKIATGGASLLTPDERAFLDRMSS